MSVVATGARLIGHGATRALNSITSLRGLRAGVRALAWFVFGVWSLVLVAWLTLHWGILPRIDGFRPQIQVQASRWLGVAVELGEIRVRSRGWVPSFELRDVVLRDAQGREALRLPRVLAAVSVRSVLGLAPRFEQLLIEGADLQVRRDPSGRVHVAGLVLDPAATTPDGNGALDWLLRQHEFVILGGRVQWIDEQAGGAPLALEAVDLVLRNALRGHDMRLDATPPSALGARFSLRGRAQRPLFSRPSEWRRWSGTVYADLPRAELAQVRTLWPAPAPMPARWSSGRGALRTWIEFGAGHATAVSADLALADLSLQLAPTLPTLAFREIGGFVEARQARGALRLAANGLHFVTDDGLDWPRSNLSLVLQGAGRTSPLWPQAADITGGEFSADRLDLALLAGIAERAPLGDAVSRLLAETTPQGLVRGLAGTWEGLPDRPARYRLQARLEGLSVAPSGSPARAGSAGRAAGSAPVSIGRPGWRHAALSVQASETGGRARLDMRDGALIFPGVFEQAEVPVTRLGADLSWRIGPSSATGPAPGAAALEFTVRDARFANADGEGRLQGVWRTGPGADARTRYPGFLQLSGQLDRGTATSVARYLPLALPADTRQYVRHAVMGGAIRQARFSLRGNLADFPFTDQPQSEFRVAAQVEDVTLAYVPSLPATDTAPAYASPWPAFTRVSGELGFERSSLRIRDARAWVQGVELSRVQGDIRALGDRSVLEIEGRGSGPLAGALRFVQASPIADWTGPALRRATGTGQAALSLALKLPLHDTRLASVRGSVTLAGNDLLLSPDTPPLTAARGRVEFSEGSMQVVGGSARVLGGEVAFEGGSQANGRLRFTGQGVATADGLRRQVEWPEGARLASVLQGQTPYRLVLGFVDGHSELLLTSSLQGMAVDLPEPLRKAADASLPLRLQTELVPGSPVRDTVRLDLGVLQAVYQRNLEGDAPRVLRGALAVRDSLVMPDAGVQARVTLDQVQVADWQVAARRLGLGSGIGSGGGSGAAGGAPPPGPADAGAFGAAGYLPDAAVLRLDSLNVGTRRLDHVQAAVQRAPSGADTWWTVKLDAEQMAGRIDYRPARLPAHPGQLNARLTRLSLPRAETDAVDALLDGPDTAMAAIPALDIVIDDLALRGRSLGRVEIEAGHQPVGDAREVREGPALREWRLSRFQIKTPEAQWQATGRWVAPSPGARRRMVMDFRLDLADSGAFAERLGLGRVLRGGRGRLTGQIGWAGSPLSPQLPSLSGRVQVALESGQFLNAEPGAARLFSVLKLQELPRRLSLDFRDVFDAGFAFDSVTGDIRIAEGVARTGNVRVRGVQAGVLMEGSADLDDETQDLRVVIVPDLNANTASLAYAAINPAVGVGAFLAQLFLRRPLMAAGTREFHVGGSWSDPVVQRVERRFSEPLPDLDPAPPAPPSAAASVPAGNP